MKTETLRRPYAAPVAELICLAPTAPIASWKWNEINGKWSQNRWGGPTDVDLFKVASVTGVATWGDETGLNDELSKS